ncbi:MAG TPA: LysM domain-containing protein, partial [Caldilineaceae bacterium]|nr:LysM domain-containing protein [Caldilineaceae bacterium]
MNQRSNQLSQTRRRLWRLSLIATLALCVGLWLMAAVVAQAQDTEQPAPGYYYTVQEGDTWEAVAQRTGVPVDQLQAANPDAVRENGWLLNGEQLFIPTSAAVQRQTHVVQQGESWASIAAKYGVPVSLLRAANPNAVRPGSVLHRGEVLIIPPVGAPVPTAAPTATPTGAATATEEATEQATEEAIVEATAEVTAEPTEEPTEAPTATATATSTATATPTATATEAVTATVQATATVEATATAT